MEISKNIIKKLTVEVDTSSMAFGLQIKNDISAFLEQHIYPKLAHYLDHNIPENELWRYEKINLEIDLDSEASFKEVPSQIISKLEGTFTRQTTGELEKKVEQITPISAPKSKVKAFIEFLKTGQYPWWFETKNPVTISDFMSIKNKLIKQRIYLDMTETKAFNRLVYQFDNQFITKIYYWHHFEDKMASIAQNIIIPPLLRKELKKAFWFAMLSHDKPKIIAFFKEVIRQLKTKTISKQQVSYQLSNTAASSLAELIDFCNKILKIGVVLSPIKKVKNTYKITLTSDFKKAISVNEKTLKFISEKTEQKDTFGELKFFILEGVIELKNQVNPVHNSEEKKRQETTSIEQKKQAEFEQKKQQKDSFKNEVNRESEKTNESTIEAEMVIEGTIIKKAGLVLLHPFLKHFFINMDLLSENKLRPERQDLAVHLLHYIATKDEQPSEHDLVFEKYLCHIPVNQPIDRFIELSSEQKQSCDDLLKAVLKHWSALRTNSIDALRSEFLLRQGKLTINDDTHRLFIQRNTQDILLDTLPWNLHLVKLPWKKQLLYVEW